MDNFSIPTASQLLSFLEKVPQGDGLAAEQLETLVYAYLRERVQAPWGPESGGTWLYGNSLLDNLMAQFCEPDVLNVAEKKKILALATLEALRRLMLDFAIHGGPLEPPPSPRPNRFQVIFEQIQDAWDITAEFLDSALEELHQVSPSLYAVVMCRFFGGLTVELTARLLDREESVVSAEWKWARALLRRRQRDPAASSFRPASLEPLFFQIVTLAADEQETFRENHAPREAAQRAMWNALLGIHRECEEIQFLEPTLISPIYALWDSDPVLASTANDPLLDSTAGEQLDGGSSAVRLSYLDRYRLLECVGRGGFAQVWRAYDPLLERIVAVKTPRTDRSFGPRYTDLFLSEARKLAGLKIPGIVQVYDTGCADGRTYIVSEFMEGGNLNQLISRSKIPLEAAVRILVQIAKALHRAHQQGLVHRDIKPANILIDGNGQPYLADFGLAVTELEQLEEKQAVVGTPAYMPPEQARGDSRWATPQSDIYSLGVVLYELLAGRLPFLAQSPEDQRGQVIHRPPRPLRTIDDSIPRELEAICLKCLEKAPERRYTTAADFADDLDAWLISRTTAANRRPTRGQLFVGIGGVAAIVGMIAWGLHFGRKAEPVPGTQFQANASGVRGLADGKTHAQATVWLGDKATQLPKAEFPKELLWPGHPQDNPGAWSINQKHPRQPIVATSFPPLLVQMGTMEPQDETIALGIRKLAWEGYAGVFWGYEEHADAGQPVARFHLIRVISINLNNGSPRKDLVQRTWGTIDPESRNFMIEENISAPVEIKTNEPRLEIQFQNGQLTSVTCEGTKLAELTTPEANLIFGRYQQNGPWGVLNAQGTTSFFLQTDPDQEP